MAEEEKLGELFHVAICVVENGYKISCQYEHEPSLSERKGWVPTYPSECKDYVEKTKAAVIERLKKVL
jgi:hypothetical protein